MKTSNEQYLRRLVVGLLLMQALTVAALYHTAVNSRALNFPIVAKATAKN